EASDTKRILERIIRHNEELFLFLDHPEIEPTNNRAERQLRPNVIMRKITFGNRSPHGAEKHQILMSIIETGRLNGVEPLRLFLSLTLGDTPFIDESIRIRGP
ncbi:MAG: transposase, partial [Candidatus Bathyarchaeota archaeon]|nr:transposase [Candidatus Bathyarchaeota archaeon]